MQATLQAHIPVQALGPAFNVLDKAGASRQFEQYLSDGSLDLQFAVLHDSAGTVVQQLRDATSGQVTATVAASSSRILGES